MRKMALTTVGTSLLFHLREKKDSLKNLVESIEGKSSGLRGDYSREFEELKKQCLSRLSGLNLDKNSDLNKSSAEIKSLAKLGITEADVVYLFATETMDGNLCAEVIEQYIKGEFGCSVKTEEVKGLQVKDSERFRKEGVRNFIDKLMNIIEKSRYEYEIIFNITGGFKAVIPYTTFVGMINSVKVVYTFEDTDYLIELPALPITYNKEFLNQHKAKFDKVHSKSIIGMREFRKGLDDEEYEKFSAMIEDDGQSVTFSALGELLYKQFLQDDSTKIHLSHKAKKVYADLNGEQLDKIQSYFKDLKDSQKRSQFLHEKFESLKTDCLCFKKPHTAERIFYFEEAGAIKVVEIFLDHNNYERYIEDNDILKEHYKEFNEVESRCK
ncbi:MAG: putative CRISPR-associated protein [Deltaproteobacteria bacterium]